MTPTTDMPAMATLICRSFGTRQVSAALNLERVRSYMETHLGCTTKEVAYALDLSGDQARRSVRKIRLEWQTR